MFIGDFKVNRVYRFISVETGSKKLFCKPVDKGLRFNGNKKISHITAIIRKHHYFYKSHFCMSTVSAYITFACFSSQNNTDVPSHFIFLQNYISILLDKTVITKQTTYAKGHRTASQGRLCCDLS